MCKSTTPVCEDMMDEVKGKEKSKGFGNSLMSNDGNEHENDFSGYSCNLVLLIEIEYEFHYFHQVSCLTPGTALL